MLARDGEDHYGRLVAHLYDRNGASMQQQLLQSGLALAYVQPPNLGNMGCYFAAEREARRSGLALWANLPLHPADLERGFAGYALVRSRIQRVRNTRRSLWIELEGGLSLRIAASDLSLFSALDFKNSVGRELEARGYIRPHRGRLRMRIRHPSSLNLM